MPRVNYLKKIFLVTTLLSVNHLACAADANTDATTEVQTLNQAINHINQRTDALEHEISSLKQQVKQLKATANYYKQQQEKQQSQQAQQTQQPVSPPPEASPVNLPFGMRPVVVAPYYGIDATAVVVTPTYNQDVKMLEQRQILENQYRENNLPIPPAPLVELSGRLEAQAIAQSGTNDINLSGAELDFASQFNPWVIGFAAFAYDNTPTSAYRIRNSRIYLDRGFITVGNLNQSPFYGSIGQRYVPFGEYNTFMVSAPLTQVIGRTNARSISFGYQHQGDTGLYTNIYAFKGDSHLSGTNDVINNYGATLGYELTDDKNYIDVGVDFIRNIADSQGMQGTTGNTFKGFAADSADELLNKTVPGIDVHGKFTFSPFTILAEYTGALHAFSPANLSFGNHGAKPRAVNLEGAYNFDLAEMPGSFALGYGRTFDALALNIPQQTYAATFNISIWKNTITSLELRHSINYNTGDIAAGQGLTVTAPSNHVANSAIARFGVYF
jgi:outer membrane murein-binding lipoprotein Lpp